MSISLHASEREKIVLIACIVALSIYLIGGSQWIDNHLPRSWIDSSRLKFFVTIAKKVLVFVAIPFEYFARFHATGKLNQREETHTEAECTPALSYPA